MTITLTLEVEPGQMLLVIRSLRRELGRLKGDGTITRVQAESANIQVRES